MNAKTNFNNRLIESKTEETGYYKYYFHLDSCQKAWNQYKDILMK